MGNLTMEVLSQLLEMVKQSGFMAVMMLAGMLFAYFKLWPLWVKRSDEAIAAREAANRAFLEAQERANNRFTDTLTKITSEHAEALERRDNIQASAAAINAAAVDRNTEIVRDLTRTVGQFRCDAPRMN